MEEKVFDTKILIEFIKKYYVLDFSNTRGLLSGTSGKLIIRDEFDTELSGQMIPLSVVKDKEVYFVWNKARVVTGIDPYHKKFVDTLPNLIIQSFRHPKTYDFFRDLYKEKIDIIISLCDIPQEFPDLFSDEL
jgi:hypothetical protein